MNSRLLLWSLGALAFFAVTMKAAASYLFPPVSPARIRNDNHGAGTFGASRGGRNHAGLDLIAAPGATVRAPFDGIVSRYGYPYAGDERYRYLEVLAGNGDRVRLFYVQALPGVVGSNVSRGQPIGTAQNIAARYSPGMINHVHVELRKDGRNVDPAPFLPLVS